MNTQDRFIIEYIKDLVLDCSKMEQGVLYFDKEHGLSFHLCACGCGDLVMLKHPEKWKLDENTITISPSIGRMTTPCKSHYFIRNGQVQWC